MVDRSCMKWRIVWIVTHTEYRSSNADILLYRVLAQAGDVVLSTDAISMDVQIQQRDIRILDQHIRIEIVHARLDKLDHGFDAVGEVIAQTDAACMRFLHSPSFSTLDTEHKSEAPSGERTEKAYEKRPVQHVGEEARFMAQRVFVGLDDLPAFVEGEDDFVGEEHVWEGSKQRGKN